MNKSEEKIAEFLDMYLLGMRLVDWIVNHPATLKGMIDDAARAEESTLKALLGEH